MSLKAKQVVGVWFLMQRIKARKAEERRQHRFWVRDIFLKRKSQGAFHNLIAEMRLGDPEKYFNFLRMSGEDFNFLLSKVGPSLKKDNLRREAISPAERLSVTLRYLASGDSMVSISFMFRLGVTTVSNIIRSTCNAIWFALKDEVFDEITEANWLCIADKYENNWNLPNCIGAADGKHIIIQAPPHTGSDFYNYKGDFSIVLMAVCDARYKFIFVDIGAKGRQSDGGIFRGSEFGRRLLNNDLSIPPPRELMPGYEKVTYYIVGDEAFPLTINLMRPYPGRHLDLNKRIFNYRLSRGRRIIENVFGILSNKWRIFRKPIIGKLETVEGIIRACVCLHNFLVERGSINSATQYQTYISSKLVDREDEDGNLVEGEWRKDGNHLQSVRHLGGNAYSQNAAHIRDILKEYFVDDNPIPPQWNK